MLLLPSAFSSVGVTVCVRPTPPFRATISSSGLKAARVLVAKSLADGGDDDDDEDDEDEDDLKEEEDDLEEVEVAMEPERPVPAGGR